jgi:hypothetical protein
MDQVLIQKIIYIVFVICIGIIYSVWNYATKTKPEDFEWKRMLASAIFGLFIGIVAVYLGLQNGQDISSINWEYVGILFITYSGALMYINRGIDWVWQYIFGAKVLAKPV